MYSSLCRLTTLLLLEKREDTSVFMSLNHFLYDYSRCKSKGDHQQVTLQVPAKYCNPASLSLLLLHHPGSLPHTTEGPEAGSLMTA